MIFGFRVSGKIIVILVARVTITKPCYYCGRGWATLGSANRGNNTQRSWCGDEAFPTAAEGNLGAQHSANNGDH